MDEAEQAFRNGEISSKEYVESLGIYVNYVKAGISPVTGEIELTSGKYFTWDKPTKQLRNTREYYSWRNSVYERDDYTCKICGKRGGELNAHHIKPFAKYKSLRNKLSNGVTLCKQCHKNLHSGVVKLE